MRLNKSTSPASAPVRYDFDHAWEAISQCLRAAGAIVESTAGSNLQASGQPSLDLHVASAHPQNSPWLKMHGTRCTFEPFARVLNHFLDVFSNVLVPHAGTRPSGATPLKLGRNRPRVADLWQQLPGTAEILWKEHESR